MQNHCDWNQVYIYIANIVNKISRPDLIIGIAGGGIIPASMIARQLKMYNITYIGLKSYSDHNVQNEIQMYLEPDLSKQDVNQNVLIVDDILDTGNTFKYMHEYLTKKQFKNIQYAALHHKLKPLQYIPSNLVYGTQCESNIWIQYAWELV